ncbi:glycosyltransferase family 4 protein [Neotabrizicola sp. VNH66]|uniref:glycosyltransferase family 4 protein n=1 Tax=Neotabrizicola sp. VNH66 TaxID=3400918 RepID=UPI003C12AFB2
MQDQGHGRTANAAIWYAPDGYDPKSKGINGRRVAGESFLRGFFAHAEAEEFVCLTHGSGDEAHFREFAARAGVTRPVRGARLERPVDIAPLSVVSFPSPNFAIECWRRAMSGGAAWAICGITHTTATSAVMQGLFDLRAAPQMPWDAVICTSRAVHASVSGQMELTDAHLSARFGAVPPRPLLPVIPLGVNSGDFTPDPAAGQALRKRLGLGPEDVACAIIARLTPHEKFDPLPVYLALAEAQRQLVGTGRLHLFLCGQFRDKAAHAVFANGAAALMPEVGFHLLDGGDAAERRATLSGADIFLFPIDNVQETFGLAPIEAMAAGLPVIVSDWDGMKDTVTPDCGIRIPTEAARADLTAHLGSRYFGGTDNYAQYLGQLSAMTRIELGPLTAAVVALARDPVLRRQMGAAGRARVRAFYDWSVVIPQYQALWAEQAAMAAAALAADSAPPAYRPGALPPGPAPGLFFADYPSRTGPDPARRYRATGADLPAVAQMLLLRDYAATRRQFDSAETVQRTLDALASAGRAGLTVAGAAKAGGLGQRAVARALLWLMKYGYAGEAE